MIYEDDLEKILDEISDFINETYEKAYYDGQKAVLDFIGSMNMCDEISDEAYRKIINRF